MARMSADFQHSSVFCHCHKTLKNNDYGNILRTVKSLNGVVKILYFSVKITVISSSVGQIKIIYISFQVCAKVYLYNLIV